ncbi:MAG: putative metal-binding motif-containing protein [Alphaproteobacteria bacterium]|nr:putative metal-binding motif-containing protein [Alphaproteobacteria bacterium]
MLLLALLSCVTQPEDDGCLSSIEAWADEDGDGYGGASVGAVCELRAGLADNPSDCDDADPDIHPGAEERCNGLDDDCIDGPDQGLPGARILYTDADGDGVGAPYSAEFRCGKARADQVEEGGDCDDDDPLVSPAAVEVCNGFDDDCDYLVDDDDGSLDLTTRTDWFRDADSDGYGGESPHRQACRAPAGFVDNPDDCDEVDPFIHPGAVEVVGDGLDQDCDTHDTCYQDRDRDGYGGPNVVVSRGDACTRADEATEGGDCDDLDPRITIPRDWYGDADGDGYGFGLPVGYGCTPPSPNDVPRQGDCDPTDPAINPGAEEVCDDAIDHDCDGNPECCRGRMMDPGNGIVGCWYTAPNVGMTCTSVCASHGGFDVVASQHAGNQVGMAFWPQKANGSNWVSVECSSTDNNTNWGATGAVPDPAFSHPACYLNCACVD